MQKSEQINDLAAALSRAQGQIKASALDGTNPHFRSEYSTLTAIWDACREALAANGLSVVQTTDNEDPEMVVLETTLLHSSGQWISGRLKMKPAKADPQGIGSALTYARRYALAALVGVAPEDDDAEAATSRQKPETRQSAAKNTEVPKDKDAATIKQGYISRIHALWKQERELGYEPPKPPKPLEEMTVTELEQLGKTTRSRVGKLADKRAAEA